jgi:hypothetical protein
MVETYTLRGDRFQVMECRVLAGSCRGEGNVGTMLGDIVIG